VAAAPAGAPLAPLTSPAAPWAFQSKILTENLVPLRLSKPRPWAPGGTQAPARAPADPTCFPMGPKGVRPRSVCNLYSVLCDLSRALKVLNPCASIR
jgi:hypothetical protein